MEHLLLTIFEQNYLQKNKLNLEADYNVKISLPEVDKNAIICSSEIMFASIQGEEKNIEIVKKLMKEQSAEDRCVAVITLSDDSDTPVLAESQNRMRKKKRKRLPSANSAKSAAPCIAQGPNHSGLPRAVGSIPPTEVFIPLNSPPRKRKRSRRNRMPLPHVSTQFDETTQRMNNSVILLEDEAIQEDLLLEDAANDSVILLEKVPVVQKTSAANGRPPSANDSIVLLEEVPAVGPRVLPPIQPQILPPIQQRILRPIVIDGNNVAREHGKAESTYSCRGIQLAVEFFLRRGHTHVTAFVPNFRRHKVHGPFPTTHPEILEEMALRKRVAFTPSRNLNGMRLACYDDRFIVELASTTDGVILSNDNYRDLVGESEAFRKTIEERLLMYCFVGDKLMIPQDPMGRNGPKLDTYLSLPSPQGSTFPASPPITLI